VELGLDVPGHPQAGAPHKPDYQSPGHDMNQAECDALVNFLKKLPAPKQAAPVNKQQGEYLAAGEAKFAAVGCATCHTKDLGDAKGIYSDLLLHDMGQDLGDSGSYGIFIPNSPEEGGDEPIPSLGQQQVAVFGVGSPVQSKAEREKTIGAMRQEWRTPPLWGVRDSGPYLHDGRADSLEQAIALHGGEASRSAQRFFELSPEDRLKVMAYLKSLGAPPTQVAAK
jgi:mono/diheme cytochrome c family protein